MTHEERARKWLIENNHHGCHLGAFTPDENLVPRDADVRGLAAEFEAVAAEATEAERGDHTETRRERDEALRQCPDETVTQMLELATEVAAEVRRTLGAERAAHGATMVERDEAVAQRDAAGQKAQQLQDRVRELESWVAAGACPYCEVVGPCTHGT